MSYQTPKGTYDILPEEISSWQKIEQIIHEVAKKYHYQEIRTPYFENTEVFARENDASDMVNKEMYTFQPGNHSYTLRPEGTAGVIRAFVQHKKYAQELPAKLYYFGPMFRHERPQKGRQRQFTQFGIENIGLKEPEVDAECIALGMDIVKELNIKSVKVCINTLGDDASRDAYREALRAYFTPHIDELCTDCHRRLEQNPLRILDCKVDHDLDIMKGAPKLQDYLNEESKEYFNKVLKALDALGIPYEVDERLVRGLDYYTHTVFEVMSTREDTGGQATIFGGGRYDHLVDYFGGPELSGIGFAIGIERLLELAKGDGYDFEDQDSIDAYVISLGDVGTKPLEVATALRNEGYTVDVNLTSRSLKSQFKSADRLNAKKVIIIGEEEARENKLNIKDQATKQQDTIDCSALMEYMKK